MAFLSSIEGCVCVGINVNCGYFLDSPTFGSLEEARGGGHDEGDLISKRISICSSHEIR